MHHLKRYFFLFIVSCYFLPVAGLPVYFHYCAGDLESISYFVKEDGCCGEEAEEEDNGCCSNEHIILQYDADYTLNRDLQLPAASPLSLFDCQQQSFINPIAGNSVVAHISPNHPPGNALDIVRTTVLRI
jgi:hypothetical protein